MRGAACLPYILPVMDSLPYGRIVLQKLPVLASILKPLQPLVDFAKSFPVSHMHSHWHHELDHFALDPMQ